MRVKIARQPWGLVVDSQGNVQADEPVTITHLDGETAAVVFAGMTGETTVAPTTNVRGEIAGWITAGEYLLTVGDMVEEPVEAAHGPKFIPETGGGVGVDARPAFQAAVDRAEAAGGGTVTWDIPIAEWRSYNSLIELDPVATVKVPSNVHIIGPGVGRSIIRQCMDSPDGDIAGSCFRSVTDDVTNDRLSNIVIRGFTYDGNRYNVHRGNGIIMTGVEDFLVDEVRVVRAWNNAMTFSSCSDGQVPTFQMYDIGSKENAEWAGVDTSACHGIVTTRANPSDPWCERITFGQINARDVQHSGMRLSSIRDSTVDSLVTVREPESPFFFGELDEDLEPADTVAVLVSTAGSWFPNGSILTIGTDRFEFDATTGNTLTGVDTEDTLGNTRSVTYPAGTEVRLGRTSGYGGLRFSNSAHGIRVGSVVSKGHRRGIHWAGTAYDCHVATAAIENAGYQAVLMNGYDNQLGTFTAKNSCVYASEALGDEEDESAAVDSTAVRLANAERCTVIGSVYDDGLDENGDPRDIRHDYGVRETGGDYNRIDVRVSGVNIDAFNGDGIHNDWTGSREDGSAERATARYVELPTGHSDVTITGSSPGPTVALNSETTGANLVGAVSAGIDVIVVDRSLGTINDGQTIVVGTGASIETAVIESVDGLEITLTDGLTNAHADGEGVYPFRWAIGKPVTLRFTGTPTLEPSDVLRLIGDAPFTPESADDRIVLIGDYDGMGLREVGGRGALYASEEDLTAHVDDSALDGGPHGLPALANNGEAWVRASGSLAAVNIATQAELDAHLHDDRYWRVLSKNAYTATGARHTGDTNETTLITVQIPAGAMGPTGRLRITTIWERNAAGAATATPRIRLGGIGGTAFLTSAGITTAFVTLKRLTEIQNRTASAQVGGVPGTDSFGVSASSVGTGTVDTTVAQDLVFTAQLGNAADTLAVRSYVVEIIYGA